MTAQIRRLNHAVLYVSDLDRSVAFYREALGFVVVDELPGAAFLRGGASENHHDLGLFAVGGPRAAKGGPGLYHLAWEVDSLEALAEMREALLARGALVGQSDHGVSKSLYGADPDGIEFEVMWAVPRDEWGDAAEQAVSRPLDLDAELSRRT